MKHDIYYNDVPYRLWLTWLNDNRMDYSNTVHSGLALGVSRFIDQNTLLYCLFCRFLLVVNRHAGKHPFRPYPEESPKARGDWI